MNYNFLVLFFICICFCTKSIAQSPDNHFCGSDIYYQKILETDKSIQENEEFQELATTQFKKLRTSGGPFVIPVVVHVIHNNGPENISDEQIRKGIQHLNDAFKNSNEYFVDGAINTEIEFCLANQDPTGKPTTGINRIQSALTNLNPDLNDLEMKNLSRWNPHHYLNIWLVREICSWNNCGVAGYAYLAAAHGRPFDGIVNEARWFGSSIHNSKVHIHEVGHYFNLYHTFQSGCKNDNCLVDGDKVCDTPPDASTSAVYPCNSIVNTCSTDEDDISMNNPFRSVLLGGLGDQNDMFRNYMDYGYQQCQNAFTPGQKVRMQAALTGLRSSLLESKGCTPSCANPINVAFELPSGNIMSGNSVAFQNSTSGAISYVWKINDIEVSQSTDLLYSFQDPGIYKVKLVSSNGDSVCTDSLEKTIEVLCPVNAEFIQNTLTINAGQQVTFLNQSAHAVSYQWFIDDIPAGTETNLNYTFNQAGIYSVQLNAVGSIANCSRSVIRSIEVLCPVQSTFSATSNVVEKGQILTFSNESLNATSYQWNVNGINYTNSTDLIYTFSEAGNTSIGLIASSVFCSDTQYVNINVTDNCEVKSKRSNIWYFGVNAGIDFNSGSPVALTNGALNTREGVAAICDRDGNILFYTDGTYVYNRNHVRMPNGSGLYGNPSSSQSAVIVPNPGYDYLYYVFTADLGTGTHGYNYSIVDMRLNGGLGDIVTASKNTALYNSQVEKIAAVRHANGKDFWIVTHELSSNKFRTYLVDQDGVTGPVISTGRSIITMPGWDVAGSFKFSPDSKMMAHSINGGLLRTEMFYFDNQTGKLDFAYTLAPLSACYGVEFSPNGNLLYVTEMPRGLPEYKNTGAVSQYNLKAGNEAEINASRIELIKKTRIGYGTLQTGPDGKIYISKEDGFDVGMPYLDVINSPNALGTACNYVENGFYLNGKTTKIGLPNYISDYFLPDTFDFAFNQPCNSPELNLNVLVADANASWEWILFDPSSGKTQKKTGTNINHVFAGFGTPEVKLVRTTDCGKTDTIAKKIELLYTSLPATGLPDTLKLCQESFPYEIFAGTEDDGFVYIWQNGVTGRNSIIENEGVFRVEGTNSDKCILKDTVVVLNIGKMPVVKLQDQRVCEGEIVNFDAGAGDGYEYQWQDGSNEKVFSAYLAGKYWVSVSNVCGTISDTAFLEVDEFPLISFEGLSDQYCLSSNTELITLTGIPDGGMFSGNGITGNKFAPGVAGLGIHEVTYTFSNSIGCTGKNTQRTKVSDSLTVESKDSSVCSSDFPITINPGVYDEYQWQDGSENSSFLVENTGDYYVKVKTANGCEATVPFTISLTAPAPEIDLKDTSFCQGGFIVFNAGEGYSYLWQDGSTEAKLHVSQTGKYWVQIENTCGTASDTAHVLVYTYQSSTFTGLNSRYCIPADDQTITLLPQKPGGEFIGTGVSGNTFAPMIAGHGDHQIAYIYTDENGCTGQYSRQTSVMSWSENATNKDTSLCLNDLPFNIDPGVYDSYLWSNNFTEREFDANSEGIYTVLVTDSSICHKTNKTFTITIQESIKLHLPDVIKCKEDTVLLDAGEGFDKYSWSNGSFGRSIWVNAPNEYIIQVSNGCENAFDTVKVSDFEIQVPEIINLESAYCISDPVVYLSATPAGGIFSGKGISNQQLNLLEADLGTHIIIYSVEDSNNCLTQTEQAVQINQDCFFVPNLITPNNDGKNDSFFVVGIGRGFTLDVYNRWGSLMFRNEDYDNNFYGEGLADGTYFFNLYKGEKSYTGWLEIKRGFTTSSE